MRTPVLIVGAGPTGLALALWLARSGVPFRIIEQHSGPGQASRAMAVQARTLEFYRQLGIADDIIAHGIQMQSVRLRKGPKQVAHFPFNNVGTDISPFPYVLSLPQDEHERRLVHALESAGVHVEWNTTLLSFTADESHVRARLQKSGTEETTDFDYLCGCDGAHSTTRQALALQFPGGTYEQHFYVADVQASGLPFNNDVNACISPRAFALAFPIRTSGMFRLIGVVPPELSGKTDITFEDVRASVKKQMNADISAVNWFSNYRVHHRVADHFRVGRVFIAGDAGHIHSPAGGQGMNTGIGDAVNLAWKLAAVIQGKNLPTLLDTYEPERIAFARSLVATTDRIFQLIVGDNLTSAAFRRVFIPYIAPLLLKTRAIRRTAFRVLSQSRIQYHASPLSLGEVGSLHAGDRLPWLSTQDNYRPLAGLNWQLHVFTPPAPALATLLTRRALPVHTFTYDASARAHGFQPNAQYLLRPDGHIAFTHPDHSAQPLDYYLTTWLG